MYGWGPVQGPKLRTGPKYSRLQKVGMLCSFSSFPSSFGFGVEDGDVPTFWLLLYLYPRGDFKRAIWSPVGGIWAFGVSYSVIGGCR